MKQSERKLQLALGKLLTSVYNTKVWSEQQFIDLAKKQNIVKAEAVRFYHALIEMDLLRFDKLRNSYVANFNVIIWSDEDSKLGLIRDIMEMFPIRLRHGHPKVARTMKDVAIIAQAEINPFAQFSAADLVRELRDRGYEVKATKTITTIEEL
jgi:hypothetical protein